MANENIEKENEMKNDEKENKQEVKTEIEENKAEVIDEKDKIKEEIDEMNDRYKRLLAEFENYKKRTQKDKEGLKDLLVSDIMTSILPVIDNLEKAVKVQTEDKAYQDGVKMVLKQLQDVLLYNGVKEIETVGKKFDPELHEAVSHVTDEKHGENVIIEEFRKGYRIGNRVIRHSMVIVAN